MSKVKLDQSPVRALTEAEAARYIGVSRSFLAQARMMGQLKGGREVPAFVRIGGGRAVRYLVGDLDAYLEKHRVSGARVAEYSR